VTPNPEPYDWACEPETHCPYCTPLDPRDIDLWAAQFMGPEADEQIQRELNL
jgi:hypothetical protein